MINLGERLFTCDDIDGKAIEVKISILTQAESYFLIRAIHMTNYDIILTKIGFFCFLVPDSFYCAGG